MDQRDEWAEPAEGWDDDPAARAYAVGVFASLCELLASLGTNLAGARVIDFGCGTGLLTEQLVADGAIVDAVDTSPAMLAVLDAKVRRFGSTDVSISETLPHVGAEPAHDLVVCSSVCAFLDDYPATLEQLVARLRPGGLFVQWDWERVDDGYGLTREEVMAALRGAGLEHPTVGTGFTAVVGEQSMAPLMGHGRRPQAG